MAHPATSPPTLRRELGKWDLTAIGINQVIGSAIFILPSQVVAQIGNWSPFAFLAIGSASLLVALCFAEVGSRFERTGGPYLYTARGVRTVRRIRGRLDAMGDAGDQPGQRRERDRAGAGILLAGHHQRHGPRHRDHRHHAGSRGDQLPGHPSERLRAEPVHHSQARAPGDVHSRRRVVHRSRPLLRFPARSRCHRSRPLRCF